MLGTFVGVFVYYLVMLRTIREIGEAEFVPSLAVLMSVLLALLGVAVLIYFVRHIAASGRRAAQMRRSGESPPGPDGVTA